MPKASERALGLAREVLAKIAAYDPYFPKPNEAMLIAWGEHISLKNPDRDDMLDAVTKFYETNEDGSKPYPASISTIARSIRQDRLLRGDYKPPPDKSDDPELPPARQSGFGMKADDRRDLNFQLVLGDAKMTQAEWERRHDEKFPELKTVPVVDAELVGNPLLVRCPWCKATVGAPCTVPVTQRSLAAPVMGPMMTKHRAHPSRWDELRKVQGEQTQ